MRRRLLRLQHVSINCLKLFPSLDKRGESPLDLDGIHRRLLLLLLRNVCNDTFAAAVVAVADDGDAATNELSIFIDFFFNCNRETQMNSDPSSSSSSSIIGKLKGRSLNSTPSRSRVGVPKLSQSQIAARCHSRKPILLFGVEFD